MAFLDWFKRPEEADTTPEALRNIVSRLEGLPPDRARRHAALAFILSRVAHADMQLGEAEATKVRELLVKLGEMSDAEADRVAALAFEESRLRGGTENYSVVREFGTHATHEEKRRLLECLFAVAAADGSISTVEANALRQIGDELKLDRTEYLAVRSRFRDWLAVLQDGRFRAPDGSSDPTE